MKIIGNLALAYIFILLKIALMKADDESSFCNNHNEQITFGKLLYDITSQISFTNIIVIAEEYYGTDESFYLHVLPSEIALDYVDNIYRDLVKNSGKAFYALDAGSMNKENQQNIIEQIRKSDEASPILVYRGYLLLNKSYNLYFVRCGHTSEFELYEICAYCNAGRDKILKFNSWSKEKGFKRKFAFPSSYKGSLYGHTLTLAANEFRNLVHKEGKDAQGKTVWGGKEYKSLELVGDLMNFEIKVKPSRTGSAIINGTATGVLGMVA